MAKNRTDLCFRFIAAVFIVAGLSALGGLNDSLAQTGFGGNLSNPAQHSTAKVSINGQELTSTQKQQLTQTYGTPPIPGDWWYDAKTGWYGLIGGPLMGKMNPGHDFGSMPANASNGDTEVFINGRQLPAQELQMYSALYGQIAPGRYWMDASGKWGVEGETRSEQTGTKSIPQAPASGSLDSRLIGVFQGEAISSGSGTYFNTQMHWVFNADGSVIYGSQGHYSGS